MDPFRPEGWPRIVPRIVTADVEGLVEFIKQVFDAEGEYLADRPSTLRIGDSLVMISDGGGAREFLHAFLYVYVPDVDRCYRRAARLGVTVVEEPVTTPYGDRRATIRDRWNNLWQIATRSTGTGAGPSS